MEKVLAEAKTTNTAALSPPRDDGFASQKTAAAPPHRSHVPTMGELLAEGVVKKTLAQAPFYPLVPAGHKGVVSNATGSEVHASGYGTPQAAFEATAPSLDDRADEDTLVWSTNGTLEELFDDVVGNANEYFGLDAKGSALAAMPGCCGGCGRQGHTPAECVKGTEIGDIMGCPLCNTVAHGVDSCRRFRELDNTSKMELLIRRRGHKQCIRSLTPWTDLLSVYEARYGKEQAAWLPLTRPLAVKFQNMRQHLHEAYQYGEGDAGLMEDPITKNLDAVRAAIATGWRFEFEPAGMKRLRIYIQHHKHQVAHAESVKEARAQRQRRMANIEAIFDRAQPYVKLQLR
ncbi:hypothetical protein MAPG_04872 [Magnaporthiopsis poae ATCC 64411]|uniref:Uncharacterized protein n=1 Tax=Magnaporthiopsis poae (strain ATCC 64411 / 73-15) TaxID=644358 RepID=A0A0C4DXW5_MAGP6|nr:hypothetical protein MAPG_04872 [Magnaporthiopsis poae ATCC 64411]